MRQCMLEENREFKFDKISSDHNLIEFANKVALHMYAKDIDVQHMK